MPAVIKESSPRACLGGRLFLLLHSPLVEWAMTIIRKRLSPCVRACVLEEKLQERLGKVSFAYREKREISAKYRPGRPGIRKQNLQRLSEGSWIHRHNTTLRVCVFCFIDLKMQSVLSCSKIIWCEEFEHDHTSVEIRYCHR